MKKFQILATLFLITSVLLSSCSNDDGEPQIDYGTTTGDYFPLTEGNSWNYDGSVQESAIYVGLNLNMGDFNYHRLTDTDTELDYPIWMRKTGASYFHKTEDMFLNEDNGITVFIEGYELKVLKDDLQAGETWSGNLKLNVRLHAGSAPQIVPASLSYTGTILARDATETIRGTVHMNVIKSKLVAVQNINSQMVTISSEYWYAKDIGIIRETITNSLDNTTKTRELTSYELK